ncbi:hypothetical protein HAX54_037283 [Datura stramonium]|uniref:Uncharacterized protein n=1 Tax=Datura stramonium TaxID=4076 RepID=A0ABS8RHB9_DATST|nr:hypothetical protein [Datura stramonium]
MATQRDLAKIGSEGFALIDEYIGKKRINRAAATVAHNPAVTSTTTFRVTKQSCNYHYSSPETHVYHVIPSTPPAALSSYEAAKLHDGIHLAKYSKGRQMRMAY